MNIAKKIMPLLLLAAHFAYNPLAATHSNNRYFFFLERPESYVTKERSHIDPTAFYSLASTSHKQGGSTGGISELWGKYDLDDVIKSLKAAQGPTFVDPVQAVTGSTEFSDKSFKFKVDGKVKAQGLILSYEQALGKTNFSLGAWLPVMHVNAATRFRYDRTGDDTFEKKYRPLRESEVLQIDKIRRDTHQMLGFQGNDWSKTGLGDTDLHLRWHYFKDHTFLMRSFDFNIQAGLIAPTGFLSDKNTPSSLSAMGNGHWGTYLDIVPECELKQDWKCGILLGLLHQFAHTRTTRIPFGKEPAPFSALTGNLKTQPGLTAKISPYFTLENLTDGLHLQARYTYLKHEKDTLSDMRNDKTIASYLTRTDLSNADRNTLLRDKKNLTRWTGHFMTLQLLYNTKDALKNFALDPTLHIAYDIPVSGNGICKTHHISAGVALHF